MLKKILLFLIIFFVMLFNSMVRNDLPNTAIASTNDLTFTMTKVLDGGNWKVVTIEVQNNSGDNYSYGWTSNAIFEFKNNEMNESVTAKQSVSSGNITPGKSSRVFNINFSYDITEFTVSGIYKLKDGFPVSISNSLSYVGIVPSDYDLVSSATLIGLSFDVITIEDYTLTKHINIRITNNTDKKYSIGWADSKITYINYAGEKIKKSAGNVSNTTIYQGTTFTDYYVKINGEISTIRFSGICELSSSGLPMPNTSFDIDCNLSSYRLINQQDALSFTLTGIKTTGDNYINTAQVLFENKTSNSYSFGWGKTSKITLSTDNKSVSNYISSLEFTVDPGISSYEFEINATLTGTIIDMTFSDIRPLKNGLPINNGDGDVEFDMKGTVKKDYTISNYKSSTDDDKMNSDDASNLEFSLTKIQKSENVTKKLFIDVVNNSLNNYVFGWVESCTLCVETIEGKSYTYSIREMSYDDIVYGENSYVFDVSFEGEISRISFNGLKRLNGNLPQTNSNFNKDCSIVKYETVEQTNDILNFIERNIRMVSIFVIIVLICLICVVRKVVMKK